ncbi:MAG TPA: hypothetical protein PKY13_06910 [Microthrixaceae bacterium]|jgi:hypothetical protein|nr:hypothetical protein [Microthrixaceae bacterium]
MSSRLEIELTSSRPDGVWTWRKAGAKMPKGEVEASKLPEGSKVGDILRADADILIDGVDILAVLPPKDARKDKFESLQVVGTRKDEPLVTQTLAPKGRGGGRDRDRGDRGDRPRRDGDRPRRDGDRPRRDGDRPGGDRGPRGAGGDRPRRPAPEPKPRAKRLRPGRTHRNAVLDSLAPEQRPIAEHVLRGGVPAVRQAVDKQNELNKAQGLPEIHGDELVALAEGLLPKLRSAEWRDKADNALSILAELDLRDLRSVVVAADTGARDDETRALAQQLRDGLAKRVEEEHTSWLGELSQTLAEGRVVRALRLSSRPPKAGAPVPAEITTKLTEATLENLTLETSQDRWAMVIDALAFSPVRTAVTPAAVPAEPTDELKAAIAKVASRVPHIAALFGIDASAAPKRKRPAKAAGTEKRPPAPPKLEAAAEPATDEAPVVEEALADTSTEAPAPEPATDEAPVVEETVAAEETEAPAEEAVAEEPVAAEAPAEETVAAEAPATHAEEAAEGAGDEPVVEPVSDEHAEAPAEG